MLEIPPAELRTLGRQALDRVVAYYASLGGRPVLEPTTSGHLRSLLGESLPQEGVPFDALLDTIDDVIVRYSRHNAHPRFFGYVSSPGTPVSALGSLWTAALNANVTGWRSAPAATELERVTIEWLKEMLGCPAQTLGLLTSGGSMANFAALAAARSAKSSSDVVRQGMGGGGKRLRIYVSGEGHLSLRKAAGMLGIGEENVRDVETDDRHRIDLVDLERQIGLDLAAGHLPCCVVANAGTTATGAFDALPGVIDVARRHGLWVHVDAAYGGFAALAPSARPLFDRIGEADSIALDPHKWLYLPVGCGCVLYRDPATARAAFGHDADYTRVLGLGQEESFAAWDYGPELSRPFRALDLWLLLKHVGARRLGEAIERNLACARHLRSRVLESDDFEMLAPVELSVFCFRHVPPGFRGDLDEHNERVLVALQRGGRSYLSNARIRGSFALRGCVLNYRTTERDMEILLDDVRRAAAAVRGPTEA